MDVLTTKSHRTALVIEEGTHAERTRRLLESLNGANIKVDVYRPAVTTSSVIKRVDNAGNGSADSFDGGSPEFDVESIHKELKAAGYAQVLFSLA
jgi:hypothetical protein